MSYRGPDATRLAREQGVHFDHAGQPVTWRQYVGTAAGVPVAGRGAVPRYRESTITALFSVVVAPESPTPAGAFAQAQLTCATRERLGRSDELVWRGVVYRVESDPAPVPITRTWTCVVKRGQ